MGKTPWLDRTEIVMGLVLKGELDPHIVNAEDLHAPYNELLPIFKKNKSVDDAINHSYSMVRDATAAADAVLKGKETTPLGWLDLLVQAASYYKYGSELAKMADHLMAGEKVDPAKLLQFVAELDLGHRALTPLSQVEPEQGQWIETGYAPIDEFIGGIPKAGLTVIAGSTGLGKTTLALRVGLEIIRKYKGIKKPKGKKKDGPTEWIEEPGKIAIFSLEMLLSQIMARYLNLDPNITKNERSRILASESAYTVGEIYATSARTAAAGNLKAIIIDFADMLVEGEQSEAVMGVIYRTLAVLAKTTGVPVILICQLNRSTYNGGIPKINHIRYSGMAEMMSSLILLLYNPSVIVVDVNANAVLPFIEGKGYIIEGKSRFGFKMGRPGAVQVDFDGEMGWGDMGYHWFNVHS
jgi:replicative DNA helicase